jgi:glucuronate isomerase
MAFITEDFLLQSKAGRRLYHEYAAAQPILDYHSHLSAKDIAENRQFRNLYEIWLEGDHYKWRTMRANGISERYCTGDADPYDKFFARSRPPASPPCSTAGRRSIPASPPMAKASKSRSRRRC